MLPFTIAEKIWIRYNITMLSKSKLDYLNNCILLARRVRSEDGSILVSGQVAQAVLEGAWGEHIPGFNTFGIKEHDCPFVNGVESFGTHEFRDGVKKSEIGSFAKYEDLYHCFKCHSLLLKQHYPTAYAAKDYMEYVKALMHDPVTNLSYATDPNYIENFISVVHSHSLDKLDN